MGGRGGGGGEGEGGAGNGDTPPTLHHHHHPHPVAPGSEAPSTLAPVSPPWESCLEGGGEGGGGGLPPDPVDGQLQALLEEVRYIVEHVREQERQLSVAEQWQFASAVIDRLCFMGFSVFNVICTISILMAAPNFAEAASKDFL